MKSITDTWVSSEYFFVSVQTLTLTLVLKTIPRSSSEMEVCKLETLLQSEVSVVSTGEVPSMDSAKTPPGLRRRKRNCPRRAGERERERDGAGGGGERGDRGIGDERERREAGESVDAGEHQN